MRMSHNLASYDATAVTTQRLVAASLGKPVPPPIMSSRLNQRSYEMLTAHTDALFRAVPAASHYT